MRRGARRPEAADTASSADEGTASVEEESEAEPAPAAASASQHSQQPRAKGERHPVAPSSSSRTVWLLAICLLASLSWNLYSHHHHQHASTQECDPRFSRSSLPLNLQSFLNQSSYGPLAFTVSGASPCLALALVCGTSVSVVHPSAQDTLASLLQRTQGHAGNVLVAGISGRAHAAWFAIALKQCIDPTVALAHDASCARLAFLFEDAPAGFYPSLIAPLEAPWA